MTDPNKNFAAMVEAKIAVKNHPMCGKFEDDGANFIVTYPAGDFSVCGAKAGYVRQSKRRALERLLERMEKDWVKSYPNA